MASKVPRNVGGSVEFEVLKAVVMKSSSFWDITEYTAFYP
jgi:hypothetical protein